MNADRLMQAMNELPEDLIAEALKPQRRVPVRRILRTVLVAALIAVLFSVTAYAAGGGLGGIVTSRKPGRAWKNLDALPKAERMLGRELVVPERFACGFVFENMNVSYSDVVDDDGAVVETYPEFYAQYSREKEKLHLNIRAGTNQVSGSGWTEREQDGVTLYCHSFIFKVVPEDYQETEEDRAQKETGELMLSWGSDRIETYAMGFVNFELDGSDYALFSYDGLAMDELCAMAGEIIRMDE